MNSKLPKTTEIDFSAAVERAMRVRRLYHQLEEQHPLNGWLIAIRRR